MERLRKAKPSALAYVNHGFNLNYAALNKLNKVKQGCRCGCMMRLDELILLSLVIIFAVAAGLLVYRFKKNPRKILTRLVAANIILDITAAVIWIFPETHWSVYQLGYMAAIAEALAAAAVFAVALFGLKKNKTWAPMLVLALTVAQRVFATYIFYPSPALALTLVWSVMLAAFAVLTIKNQSKP